MQHPSSPVHRAARAPYHCPACARPILAAHKLLPHMSSCCPDLLVATGSERWAVALGVTPPWVLAAPMPKHQRLSEPTPVAAGATHQPLPQSPPPPPPPHLLQGAATSPSPAVIAATVAAAATTVTAAEATAVSVAAIVTAAAAVSAASSPHQPPPNPAGAGKAPKSWPMVDDGAVRKLLEEAQVKEVGGHTHHCTTSHDITPHHTTLHHTAPHHMTPHHITPYHTTSPLTEVYTQHHETQDLSWHTNPNQPHTTVVQRTRHHLSCVTQPMARLPPPITISPS